MANTASQPEKRPARVERLPAKDAGRSARIDLGEGEEIVVVTSPHWLFVLLDRPGVTLFLALVVVGVFWLTGDFGLRASSIVLFAGWIVWEFIERASRRYVLTTRRVVSVAGVLRQGVVDAPIGNVRQVTMFKSLPERVLGLGTLGFATAGTGGQDVIWRLIDRPGERFGQARRLIDPPGSLTQGDGAE